MFGRAAGCRAGRGRLLGGVPATLGVATFTYLPWVLFNLASVGFSILWAVLGVNVLRAREDETPPRVAEPA